MKIVTTIISLLSVSIFFLTINRTTNLTLGHLNPYEFLRWQDFNAMLLIPLVIIVLYSLLFLNVAGRKSKENTNFGKYIIVFVVGTYLYGVSSGNHEVTNYLNHRFCLNQDSSICKIISFNDDSFSHLIFYISTILMTSSLLLFEYHQPLNKGVSRNNKIIITINALLIAIGIVVNLAYEKLGIDLLAFSILATLSGYLFLKIKSEYSRYPIIYYATISYFVGTSVTIVIKLVSG